MADFLRADLLGIPEVFHGGGAEGELLAAGADVATAVDLSVNTNPLGPSPRVIAAVSAARLDRYPQVRADRFRQAVAERYGLSPDQVVAGNGSAELIWLTALATITAGTRGFVVGPTFGEYARAIRVAGGRPAAIDAAPPDFLPPVPQLLDPLRIDLPKVVYLANPNNPTGQAVDLAAIEEIAAAFPSTLLVVDQAYWPFAVGDSLLGLLDRPNVVLLRSLTKDHAIPGLRLGYSLSSKCVAELMRAVSPPWNVSAPAIAAGLAALDDEDWAERGIAVARSEVRRLSEELTKFGTPPVPTQANFLMVRVGDGAGVRKRLLSKGIVIRDCASFGLPEYVRIAAGVADATDRLLASWPDAVEASPAG